MKKALKIYKLSLLALKINFEMFDDEPLLLKFIDFMLLRYTEKQVTHYFMKLESSNHQYILRDTLLTFKRIRELLNEGVSVGKAIEDGYSNAIRAILDSNITTLLAAVILYAYGTGPIKGFAITISIGIMTSMLTAILGTHGMYEALLPKINKDKNLRKWFGVK